MTTTAPVLSVVEAITDDTPRVEISIPATYRHRGKHTRRLHKFNAYARTDGGSLLRLVGGSNGQQQAAGLQAFLFRNIVDDDGVPFQAVPRLMSDDDIVEQDELAGEPELPDAELAPIPEDTALGRLGKTALLELALSHGVVGEDDDSALTKSDLASVLARHRDAPVVDPGSDLAEVDDDELLDEQVWRWVWPDEQTGVPSGELATDKDGDDFGEFATLAEAQARARDHGSSLRRFVALMDDIDAVVQMDDLNSAVGDIAGGAAGRPTKQSGVSSRSRRARTRSRR